MNEEQVNAVRYDPEGNQKNRVGSPKKKKASWLRTILWMLSMVLLVNVVMAIIAYFLFFKK